MGYINNKVIINDHFQKDLRKISGNINLSSMATSDSFYQEAVSKTIKKSCDIPQLSNFESDHYHPPINGIGVTTSVMKSSSCGHNFYAKARGRTIHKNTNRMTPSYMENDHYHPSSSSTMVGGIRIPYQHAAAGMSGFKATTYVNAEQRMINKPYNKMPQIHQYQNDQWTPVSQSQQMNKTNNVYDQMEKQKITKSYNHTMENSNESDQWHASSMGGYNARLQVSGGANTATNLYQQFESKKNYKPWHETFDGNLYDAVKLVEDHMKTINTQSSASLAENATAAYHRNNITNKNQNFHNQEFSDISAANDGGTSGDNIKEEEKDTKLWLNHTRRNNETQKSMYGTDHNNIGKKSRVIGGPSKEIGQNKSARNIVPPLPTGVSR